MSAPLRPIRALALTSALLGLLGCDGLGRAIINFNSQYVTGPEKLWAAILACAVVGILFFTLVRAAELLTLRGRGIRPEVA